MKKSLFFVAAASALMLTACSSESDVVQNTTPQTQTTVQKKAVGFDTYTAGTTRAGSPVGVMNTDKLKTTGMGFGVFAMFQDNADYTSTLAPNFMFNEHVSWNGGWTYSPLKYWPNETTNDSQNPAATAVAKDKLSFFAYAPYVNLTTDGNMITDDEAHEANPANGLTAAYVEATPSEGILAITKEDRANDPLVEWGFQKNLDQNVDLLWGVAPAGMSYTDVSGSTTSVDVGMPLKNMVKPDKDQKMKFLFQHALSRIGLSVVSAIDQIAAGDDGNKFNNAQTRVLIKSIRIFGNFGTKGVLNLNNATPNVANWLPASIATADVNGTALLKFDAASDQYIAPALRYDATQISAVTSEDNAADAATAFAAINKGVLPSEQTLLAGGPDPSKKVTSPTYAYETVLYKYNSTTRAYEIATATTPAATKVYSMDGSGNFTKVSDGSYEVDGSTQYYTLSGADGASSAAVTTGDAFWTKSGDNFVIDHATSDRNLDGSTEYLLSKTPVTATYAAGTYYTGLSPRYFMVIPTGNTNIKVQITYAVVTYDDKLNKYITNVENIITKATSINLENGKSYKLKLILGLTSVKLDATVSDWQVADDTEIWLPQNN